ncbi:ArsA family ATPase [Thermovibrio sp.]
MKRASLSKFKVFFLSGKGGVGKSTLSSALALALSESGFKTLLVSLDPAHCLSLLLKREVGGEVKKVEGNLYALEVELERQMKEYLRKVEREAEKVVSPALLGEVKRQIELAYYSPGAYELATVDSIYGILKEKEKEFDKVVFDTAPSGYTVRLMASPKKLLNWIDSLISLRKEANRYREMAGEEGGEDKVLEVLKRRREEYRFLGELFKSPKTLFSVVVNPGELPLKIGKRTVKELEEAGVKVPLILANKFKEEKGELFKRETLYFPPLKEEPIGIESLRPLTEAFKAHL